MTKEIKQKIIGFAIKEALHILRKAHELIDEDRMHIDVTFMHKGDTHVFKLGQKDEIE